jgi:hypothetical protein
MDAQIATPHLRDFGSLKKFAPTTSMIELLAIMHQFGSKHPTIPMCIVHRIHQIVLMVCSHTHAC